MLEKEMQIETKGKGWEQNLYQIMMWMCLLIHILLTGFFACMHIWFMVAVNVLSVLLYCFGAAKLVRPGRSASGFWLFFQKY